MPLILALVAFTLIVGAGAWVWSTGWLIRSGAQDLAQGRRVRAGTDPVQLAAQESLVSARRSYLLALDALTDTVETWRGMQRTLGIGTPLQDDFARTAARADADSRLADLLEQATAMSMANRAEQPDRVADLLDETSRMDELTVQIRAAIHRAAAS